MTTGRGKADLTHQANRSIKQVLGYPLVKDFSTAAVANDSVASIDSAGSMKPPELVTATQAELDEILALTKPTLPAKQYQLLVGVLGTFVYVMQIGRAHV